MTLKQSKIFIILIAIIISVLYILVAVSNVNTVLNWFLTDDAFYYFQVARNVSEGAGFSFDGVNLSNGFHPLWMFICIPVFYLARFDLILPLRVLILVIGLFHMSSFILLFRLLKRFLTIDIAALFAILWGFSPLIINHTFKNGLESGINVFFILLLWDRLSQFNLREKIDDKDIKKIFWLGVIGVLTILSRLDNVFLVFFAGLWLWLKNWQSPKRELASIKEQWFWRFKTGKAFYGIIVLVMSSYMVWNKLVFGDYMPISGKVKQWWGNLFYTVYGHRVTNTSELFEELFSPNYNVGPWALLISKIHAFTDWSLNFIGFSAEGKIFDSAVWGMMILLTILIMLLLFYRKKKLIELFIKMGLFPFFLGTLFQAAYYKRYGSVAQRSWYWVSENIFITLIVALLVYLIYSLFSKQNLKIKYVLLLIIPLIIWFSIKNAFYIRLPSANNPNVEKHDYLLYAEFIEENFKPGTVFGMIGSGAWGYFSEDFKFINLDGLINSKEYFELLKEGDVSEFLTRNGVDYIMSKKYLITETTPYNELFKDNLKEIDIRFRSPGTQIDVFEFIP